MTGTTALQRAACCLLFCRCPRLFTYSVQRQAVPVVEFLQKDLGFDQQQVASTIKRFPHLLGYQVKAHLAPHLHYLKSLGISDEQLPQLILARPHVLVGQGCDELCTVVVNLGGQELVRN